MTLLRYLPFFVYRTYCRQKSVSQGVYGASTIDKTSKTQLGGGSTEKTCVLQIAYGAFTIAKNSKTWSGSDPTKIRFTNSIWRVYHWQNSIRRFGGGPATKIHFANSIRRVYHWQNSKTRFGGDPATTIHLRKLVFGVSNASENTVFKGGHGGDPQIIISKLPAAG